MKKIKFHKSFLLQFLMLLMFINFIDCSSKSTLQNRYSSLFKFYIDSEEYLIIGYPAKDAEGYNLLIGKENNGVILKCIDKQQDGILDEVQEGKISLDEANKIYKQGITMAESEGRIKKKDFERYFKISTDDYYFEIRTYILISGECYNIFSAVENLTKSTSILLDEKADGLLDNFLEGDGDLKEYQSLYAMVLQKGIEANKMQIRNDIYQVIK